MSSGTSGASGGAATSRSTYGSRSRGSQPQTGIAKERPADYYGGANVGFYYPGNPFSPWGRWYPWYNAGFGYGYVSYDPWRYGSSRYSLWRYGSWYNPYDPFCYSAGYWMCDAYGGGWSGGGGGGSTEEGESDVTGSVRLRISPAHAKVFVDGTLVGVVDDFDGLRGHLKLTLGTHVVEIKADGYETFVPEIVIAEGKTITVRGTLKKVAK